ncbi:leupaxin-like [Macrosteles quadrilineatus]|uniref:leupaxin-like n=1 Tax=Macrosteles quadrilineatus TaxID=74068 RepID=UPI0023E0F880|nr:leupaxin-like [Macrosteles quadrilineatus]
MSARTSQIYKVSEVTPNCAQCNKPITDTVVAALGKTWHPEHFTCAHCKKPIREPTFREQSGQPYCEADYMQLYGKSCSGCGQPIKNTILTALNKTWHQECFKCTKCQKVIALKEFTEKHGNPFCMGCGK